MRVELVRKALTSIPNTKKRKGKEKQKDKKNTTV